MSGSMLNGRLRHDNITNTEVFELMNEETGRYENIAIFKLILMCKMKVYENDMTYNKTELLIQSTKDKPWNKTIDSWTKEGEDWDLSSNWVNCFNEAIHSRKSSLWKNDRLLLLQTFKKSLLNNTNYNIPKTINVHESLMLLTGENGEKIESPELSSFYHSEITVDNQKKIVLPIESKNILFNFKKIGMIDDVKTLNEKVKEIARSEEELIIYKTIMSWVVLNMLKRQLIDLKYPLYPAIILIGEKKTGKSTATKLFCDMGFDYDCTGRDAREAILKQKFSSVFPIMFSEIEWVIDEQMDAFKETLTSGQFIINKGKNTGASQGWIYRLINPFIFNTNQFIMQDDTLKRRFYAINYPNPPSNSKMINGYELVELKKQIQGFYKWVFFKWLPKNISISKLKSLIKETRNFNNEAFSFMQMGELILNQIGVLTDVELINLDLDNDESYMVVRKDLIMKEIKRVISSRDFVWYDRKDDMNWNIKYVMENKHCPIQLIDLLSSKGLYFQKNKDYDMVCIDSSFINQMKERMANQFKKLDMLGKKIDKSVMRTNVHTSTGSTTRICLKFTYKELYGEDMEEEITNEEMFNEVEV